MAGKGCPLPIAGLEAGVCIRHVAAHRQQDRHGVLGRRVGVAERRVDDDDALFAGGRHVDVVDADSGPGDDLQVGGVREQVAVDLGTAAGDNGVVFADGVMQRLARQAEPDIDLDAVVVEDRLEPLFGYFIGDDNFHW